LVAAFKSSCGCVSRHKWHIHHGHPRAASTPTRGTCMLHRHFVHDISRHTTHVLVCHIGLARSHIYPLLLSLQLSLQTICSTGGSCESLSKPSLFTLSLAPCTNARSKARTHTHARTYACMYARMYARACAHTPAHTCVRSLVFLTSFPRSIAALLLVLSLLARCTRAWLVGFVAVARFPSLSRVLLSISPVQVFPCKLAADSLA
jgi:hypothetical protein